MDLKSALQKEHSKKLTLKIANYVGTSDERFSELLDCISNQKGNIAQRGSWAVPFIGEAAPEIISKHLEQIIDLAIEPEFHSAVARNLLKSLTFVTIPERFQGTLFDLAINYIPSDKPVAIRVYAMKIAFNIAKEIPELLDELKSAVKERFEMETAGYKAAAKRVLNWR